MVTEGAIGRLKNKFRVLHKKCESDKETAKRMALACIVLHNICTDRGDLIPRVFDLFVILQPITAEKGKRFGNCCI